MLEERLVSIAKLNWLVYYGGHGDLVCSLSRPRQSFYRQRLGLSLVFSRCPIGDPRTDKRIDFVGGIRGTDELERRVQAQAVTSIAAQARRSVDAIYKVLQRIRSVLRQCIERASQTGESFT